MKYALKGIVILADLFLTSVALGYATSMLDRGSNSNVLGGAGIMLILVLANAAVFRELFGK